MRRAQKAAEISDLCVCVQDVSRDVLCQSAGGDGACSCRERVGVETVAVLNKIDLLEAAGLGEGPNPGLAGGDAAAGVHVCRLSCKTGEGLSEFVQTLEARVAARCQSTSTEGPAIAHARHRAHLQVLGCEGIGGGGLGGW